MRKVQAAVDPVQAPVQPSNTEPAAGLAVRVMVEPAGSVAEHRIGQLMPPVSEVTVPEPRPATLTDAW